MTRTRKILAAMFVTLSILGVGGATQPASASADGAISATRWCC